LDSGFYAACSGLKSQTNALEIAANNIANVSTTGYSAAQLDRKRAGELASAMQSAFQHSTAPVRESRHEQDEFEPLRRQVNEALAGEIAEGTVAVRETPDGLVISLREIGFFSSGSADIRPTALGAFGRLALVLKQVPTEISIEGHTDDVPIHNARFASNWDLSAARATSTIRLLITEYELDPTRLAASGYGEYRPAASNASAEGRAANRRVDIVVRRRHAAVRSSE
jgi:chemotaxis protein MotB